MSPPVIRRFPGGYDYYHEKMEAEEKSQKTGTRFRTPEPAGGVEKGDDEGGDRKALRRERAQKRQELAKERRPLETTIRAAEKRIAELERERDLLSGELMKPAPGTDYATINRRLSEIQAALAETVERWEKASLELETLPGE
jgi:ATP-binding cassette subfamily F protein 3